MPWIWVIDPESRRGEIYTASGMNEPRDGVMRTADPVIEIALSEILAYPSASRVKMRIMPPVAALVPVEEYLNTSYHPDREYVAGVLVERNVGKKKHTLAQRALIEIFAVLRTSKGYHAFQEQRVQVRADKVRLPDVCVYVGGEPDEEVFTTPPFLAIEILWPDDRHADLMEKIDDYRSFGIPWIWVIDPESRRGEIYTASGMNEPRDGVMRTADPVIEIALSEILA